MLSPEQSAGIEPNPESNNEDNIWPKISKKVSAEIKKLAEKKYKQEGYDDKEISEEESRLLASEENFIKSFEEKFSDLLQKCTGKIDILFDIDETIASYQFTDKVKQTIIRPSFPFLLEKLAPDIKEGRVGIGFITSRAKDSVIKQLGDPDHLAELNQFVDKNLVYSSRDIKEPFFEIGNDDREFLKNHYADIIDVPEDTNDINSMIQTGELQKLELIKTLKDETKDNILIVDDFVFPKYLNHQKINGLAIPHSSAFFL